MFGSKGGREFVGEWNCEMLQENVAKQARKRPRKPTVKIKVKKKAGSEEKVGKGLVGYVRPLYAHDENDCLMRCSPPSLAIVVGKKRITLYT